MKDNYITPHVEVIEIEIEDVVLLESGARGVSFGYDYDADYE